MLLHLQRDAPDALAQITAAMGRIVPGLCGLRVKTAGGYQFIQVQHDAPRRGREWRDAKEESDGTLRSLGLITALYQRPLLNLTAIEEPELTVHPGALAVLRDVIVEVSLAGEERQVIITTHSPDLMNLFDVDVLRVVEMTGEGTKIGPVAEYQREAVRENLFLPGELARIEGLVRAQ